ncbi:acyl-CoA reductase [Leeuwenhoekiella nanhaiensis]|uniref:Acyl-CoA reductase n=1 Tax=Leeuwenhoekiella nanhaiensis TaxID=1655491 RepID=A0A2G1VUJ9_9FLAO|nr:acyl-CoA reductase [Leeuwenhoekiella nanhaiensis]PHQ30462.1 acyl-CoA reductase [Leeuwenhoekiella nanhaiensis]
MDLKQRITAFANLGQFLTSFLSKDEKTGLNLADYNLLTEELEAVIDAAYRANSWFTPEHINLALHSWADALKQKNLKNWLEPYAINTQNPKTVAVIMAGNLPLVGFHDFVSVLLSGHHILAKLSSDDKLLMPFLAKVLIQLEPGFAEAIRFTDKKLTDYDAVIATGSNNSARYFEYYFKDKPHIIRKNRNAVAVLTGNETHEQLVALGNDIFTYFGMGCRSVSKLFVPKAYNFDAFFKAMYEHREVIQHHKYANNYDYNKAVYLMSLFPILDNEFMVLKEDENFSSPISVIFYGYYESEDALRAHLNAKSEEIQCVVASGFDAGEIAFGQAQKPKLHDYADGVDTVAFLLKI